jgi:hypothetical protein
VLVAIGVLPGYRGVWRAMFGGGRVREETARRVWPGWTERAMRGRDGERADDAERDASRAAARRGSAPAPASTPTDSL